MEAGVTSPLSSGMFGSSTLLRRWRRRSSNGRCSSRAARTSLLPPSLWMFRRRHQQKSPRAVKIQTKFYAKSNIRQRKFLYPVEEYQRWGVQSTTTKGSAMPQSLHTLHTGKQDLVGQGQSQGSPPHSTDTGWCRRNGYTGPHTCTRVYM